MFLSVSGIFYKPGYTKEVFYFGLSESDYEANNRCKVSKSNIDIFKADRGNNASKGNSDITWTE